MPITLTKNGGVRQPPKKSKRNRWPESISRETAKIKIINPIQTQALCRGSFRLDEIKMVLRSRWNRAILQLRMGFQAEGGKNFLGL
jgi:hypothetical protein